MSVNAELAAAARWVKAAADRLPPEYRPSISLEWSELMDRLEDCRSDGSRELAIIEWREEMAERLAVALAHSPLEEAGT